MTVAISDTRTPHAFLRDGTAAWHGAVEAAFAGLDLQSRPGLSCFLGAQARAVLALEAALERCGIEGLCPDWPQRRRGDLLRIDLQDLGCPMPSVANLPDLDGTGRCLGALYVLEGSRLGGRLLARDVRRSADPQVRGAVRFLEHEPAPQAWTRFRALLNQADADRHHLLEGAERAFATFHAAARHCQI